MPHKIPSPKHWSKTKILLVTAVAAMIVFNLAVFSSAYSETFRLDGGGTLSKDFSAYYIGAWRLWHSPAQIYTHGAANDGEPLIAPQPQAYKYLPSFLLLMSPFQLLSYHDGLVVFDIFQFALLPIIAVLLYNLLRQRGAVVVLAVAFVALYPFPLPHWGLFATYFWQWAEGQAKVLETFLFVLSFYFGSKNKPIASGVTFAFAAFDPRFALLGLPLFLYYNKNRMFLSTATAATVLVASNFILFYPPTGAAFFGMVFNVGMSTGLYAYAFIPLLTLASLLVINSKDIAGAFFKKKVNEV